MVSCHIPMETLRADVEKFNGGYITNCFEKYYTESVCFSIVKFGLTMDFAEVLVCQFVQPSNFPPVETDIIDA